MIEPPSPPERIDLARCDDSRDVVHRAVACLAQGGVVGLATETVYGLAASALRPESVARIRGTIPEGEPLGLTLLVKGAVEAEDWFPNLSGVGARLARRGWPGPLTLQFPDAAEQGLSRRLPPEVRSHVFPQGSVALRSPSHPFLREVLRLHPAPLVLSETDRPDPRVATTPDAFAALPDLAMVVDDGTTLLESVSTVVQVEGDRWKITRAGAFDEPTIRRMAGTILLFVCTGNTCRSPMAEALFKVLLARRLGCDVDEVEERGFVVFSAGIATSNGMPAAAHAIEVVRARGGTLQNHSSRQLTPEMVLHADHIITMTNDHLETLLDHIPDCAPRARLLHPDGDDVADPVGSDRETYLRTARAIEDYLQKVLDDLNV